MPQSSREAIKELADNLKTRDEKPGCWAAIITVTVALGLLFPIAYLRGWVALKLWTWFAAPVWPGVHLTIYTMAGLMLLVAAFRHPSEFKGDENKGLSKIWSGLITTICYPLALLGTAWVWTWLAWGQ